MEIKYLGWESFLLREKSARVLTTPYSKSRAGVNFPKVRVDIVVTRVGPTVETKGRIKPFSRKEVFYTPGPGEYEVGGVDVRGFNFGYWFDISGWSIFYCWDASVKKVGRLESATDQVDLMFLGVSEKGEQQQRKIVDFIKKVSPSVIIPFPIRLLSKEQMTSLSWAKGILDVLDQEDLKPVDIIRLNKQELEGETRVFLLKPKF
jgi:hypothetical protein